MKKLLINGLMLGSLLFPAVNYAEIANAYKFFVENKTQGLQVSIVNDLVCGIWNGGVTSLGAKYTSPLRENPINPTEKPLEIEWKNCTPARVGFTYPEHSKIYVELFDPVTQKKTEKPIALTIKNEPQVQYVLFDINRVIRLSLEHVGTYGQVPVAHSLTNAVFKSETQLHISE